MIEFLFVACILLVICIFIRVISLKIFTSLTTSYNDKERTNSFAIFPRSEFL
eukprot:UN09637